MLDEQKEINTTLLFRIKSSYTHLHKNLVNLAGAIPATKAEQAHLEKIRIIEVQRWKTNYLLPTFTNRIYI